MKNKLFLKKREESDEAKLKRIIDEELSKTSIVDQKRRLVIRGSNQEMFDEAMRKEVESWSTLGKE